MSLTERKAGGTSPDADDYNAVVDAVVALQAGGGDGSQPGALCSAELRFTEVATAGTYTDTLDLAAGSVVIDVLLYLLAYPWGMDANVDALIVNVGDGSHADGYFGNLNLLNYGAAEYSSLNAGNRGMLNVGSVNAGGLYQNAAYGADLNGTGASGLGVRYASADTITATIETTIETPPVTPNGVLLVKVLYFAPVTATDAVFVAAP